MTTQLTEAGQKLADALVKAGICQNVWDGSVFTVNNMEADRRPRLNTAAQILLTSEEAVLREAIWAEVYNEGYARSVAFARAAADVPLAPKTSAPGNDAGMREALAERLDRLAKDAWTGSVEEWTHQAVLAMHAASKFLSAPQPPKAETPAGVAPQGTLHDEPYDPLKCAIWAALMPFREELETKGSVTFMGLRNSIVEAVRSFAIASQSAALSLAPAARAGEGVERVRHLKRGTEYEVLGEAEAQVGRVIERRPIDEPVRLIRDGDLLTVYRDPKSGKLWCRFTDEFRDGRFVTLTAAPAANGKDA